ncbi:DEKNAAC101569 [Brettanomyces naardenensis]|uniref:DEKNAAC101569 n=1 Tax=Brettanomyces naardenensis TaxID=13370 RepID=A0A448YIM1_BRENA|nr:DEKNAAC101569 [Brettanomyces naardenensis]
MKVLGSLLLLASVANCLHFYVETDESKCFFEDLPKDTIVVGKYEAYEFDSSKNDYVNSNHLQVEITVDETFDNNHRVVSQKNSPIGQFTFTSLDSGEHKFCITPKHTDWSKRSKHRIFFDLAVGDAKPLVDSRRDEDVSFLTMKTNELLRRLEDIRREQQLFRVKEAGFRDASESVNYNSVKWTFVQVIVLIAIGVWQMTYLKSYFVKQKVV